MSFYGKLLALSTNAKLGFQGLLGTNTLAYLPAVLVTKTKSFITLTPIKKTQKQILFPSLKFALFVSTNHF
jgi:hypothetical protein